MKNLQSTTKKGLKNVTIAFILILGIVLLSTIACQSKSGHITDQPMEKVVIIDSYYPIDMNKTHDGTMYKYKVKRLKYNVVDVIYDYNKYETNDTIFHRFPYNIQP